MNDLENSTREYKVFDPRKAKAQIDVYKEIYSIMDKEDEGKFLSQWYLGEQLKLLSSASQNDKKLIAEYFSPERLEELDKSELKKELEKLQLEVDSLEEVKSSHQGFKLLRTSTTKDVFEEAFTELRDKQFEKKFRKDKERLIGDEKPKTV